MKRPIYTDEILSVLKRERVPLKAIDIGVNMLDLDYWTAKYSLREAIKYLLNEGSIERVGTNYYRYVNKNG